MSQLLSQQSNFLSTPECKKLNELDQAGQSPEAIVVCCSDSRVPPEIVFQKKSVGELFVIRTAGNVIDDVALASIEYCLLYTSPSPRDKRQSRMPSSA